MLSRLSKLFVVMTLIFAVGAHWTFLQSVAWVGMAVNYSHNSTLTDALTKTFDGKHPCKLCHFVAAGQKAEKQQETQTPLTKIDFALVSNPLVLYPLALEPLPVRLDQAPVSHRDAPPFQPPRQLLS